MVEAELSDAHLPMVSLWNSDIFVCGEGREKKWERAAEEIGAWKDITVV